MSNKMSLVNMLIVVNERFDFCWFELKSFELGSIVFEFK